MLARTQAFDATIAASHTPVAEFHILDGDQITKSLDVVDAGVTADSSAAQMRSFTAIVGDPDGQLTPASLADALGPGGSRCRVMRGVRIENVVTVGGLVTTATGWTPTTTVGVLNGLVATSDGGLTLGYT